MQVPSKNKLPSRDQREGRGKKTVKHQSKDARIIHQAPPAENASLGAILVESVPPVGTSSLYLSGGMRRGGRDGGDKI